MGVRAARVPRHRNVRRERFDDLRHLNRAGADGWQAYDRHARLIGQPQRLNAVTYSLRRRID
jgi:hypothetical protein